MSARTAFAVAAANALAEDAAVFAAARILWIVLADSMAFF